MELLTYWRILRRRWWLPGILVLLTLVFTLITQRPWQPPPPLYQLQMSFSVGVQPQTLTDAYTYDGYYTALSSEYLIDDFSEIVKGSEFATAVSQRLASQDIVITPGTIQGSAQTGTIHRILQIVLSSGDAGQLSIIADAVAATLSEDAHLFMPRLGTNQGAVYLIHRGDPVPMGSSLRQRLDLPLRLTLALLAGVGLVFLLAYLDDRVLERHHLEALGIVVLAEIPKN